MTNNKELLHTIYDCKSFADKGHDLINLLEEYLDQNLRDPDKKTIPYLSPDEMLAYWENYGQTDSHQIYKDFLAKSIHVHNTKYIGHQVVPPAPDAVLAALLGAMVNNGGAVYEMGMASNALEKIVIDRLKGYFGYGSEGGGLFTSGGTLANLTALLCARSIKGDTVWVEGTKEQYAFMVSAEAHYCIERAVRIMGWGDDGVIKVPVDESYRLRTDLLEEYKIKAEERGIKVIGVVGSAPTTSTGNYDDIGAIGDFAELHGLWFHIDGAHGGPAVFSSKYKHFMKGCQKADSITVDGHKMMMMPALTTKLFFKEDRAGYQTFSQEAQYLWSNNTQEWHNPGKRTFECTKLIMSLQYYLILQQYGHSGFGAFVEECYDNGTLFANMIEQHPSYELAVNPDSNIVCFRPVGCSSLQSINQIRQSLLQDGRYYIVQTTLKGEPYLRVSIMNPFTSQEDFEGLLTLILDLC